jgi:hypothetical protein
MNRVVNHNPAFVGCAVLAVLLLVYACLFGLGLVATTGLRLGTAIAGYTLLLEFVVGIFTVWGLFWAATEFSEFAVKPDVHLLAERAIGSQQKRRPQPECSSTFIVSELTQFRGGTGFRASLHLENSNRKPARNIALTLKVRSEPCPWPWSFKQITALPEEVSSEHHPQIQNGELRIWVRFSNELVVYDHPVFIGNLEVVWDNELKICDLPEVVVVDYDTYSLDGTSHGKLQLQIIPDKRTDPPRLGSQADPSSGQLPTTRR